MRPAPTGGILTLLAGLATAAAGQQPCDFSVVPGAVWWGPETQMRTDRIAAYLAPILWFSPDEPLLRRSSGPDIRIPEAIPPEPVPERPVLYYQIDRVMTRPDTLGSSLTRDSAGPAATVINFNKTAVIIISYFAHYASEEGLGAHPHDIEPAEFRVSVIRHSSDFFDTWFPKGSRCRRPRLGSCGESE